MRPTWCRLPKSSGRDLPGDVGAAAVRAAPSTMGTLVLGTMLLALGLSGCGSTGPAPVDSRDGSGPVPAGYYRIREGDTLDTIAAQRKLGVETLAGWNDLRPPYRVDVGKLLRVDPPGGLGGSTGAGPKVRSAAKPAASAAAGAKKPARNPSPPAKTATPGAVAPKVVASKAAEPKASASGLGWRWPLDGRVVKTFRQGDRTRQGIRIAGRAGQQVAAAESGTVVYSGSGLKGYGNLIILKHNDNYLSAYAFNRRLVVAEGQRVKRGQGVAEVGQAPGGEYLLHFEIRRNGTAVDPLRYLPESR